jgi:hypothetical protein
MYYKGTKEAANSYPITLTSDLPKILEKVTANQLIFWTNTTYFINLSLDLGKMKPLRMLF